MVRALSIDPGTTQSAYAIMEGKELIKFGKVDNWDLLDRIQDFDTTHFAIEMIASYGQRVGAETFETCVWIGRFWQAWEDRRGGWMIRVLRKDVTNHICPGVAKVNDSAVRRALIERYGGDTRAVGRKATPGPLYGVSKDVWAAIGVNLTAQETRWVT